jgi:hypothetical protein
VAPLTWIQWHIGVERSREDGRWRPYANDNQLSHGPAADQGRKSLDSLSGFSLPVELLIRRSVRILLRHERREIVEVL